jgi:hypothetical protein
MRHQPAAPDTCAVENVLEAREFAPLFLRSGTERTYLSSRMTRTHGERPDRGEGEGPEIRAQAEADAASAVGSAGAGSQGRDAAQRRAQLQQLSDWGSKLANFLEHQYQRTSVPVLIISLCTLGVAATGLIYTISNYNNQQIAQEENQRTELLRNTLRQYYKETTELITEDTHLPPDVSTEELNKHIQKANQWAGGVYRWSKQNLGDAAADILTERQPVSIYEAAHGSKELNNLLHSLFSIREDVKKLLADSDMWEMQKK